MRFMRRYLRGCRAVEGLMAAAVYETLEPGEDTRLKAHLEGCPACREEMAGLRQLSDAIQRTNAPFEGDLLPALRERIAEESLPAKRALAVLRYATPALALTFLATVGLLLWQSDTPPARESVEMLASPMEKALVEARSLAGHNFMGALNRLGEAISAQPRDPRAAEAQLLLADLEFGHGQRYAEAYKAYRTLRTQYPAAFEAQPAVIDRFDLLDEAKQNDFEALYALDQARGATGDSFAALERIVARYPDSLVAGRAVDTMVALVAGETTVSGDSKAAAMIDARDRCSDPIAMAQLSLDLGFVYWEELNDPATARSYLDEAAGAGHAVLALAAQEALARLDATAP